MSNVRSVGRFTVLPQAPDTPRFATKTKSDRCDSELSKLNQIIIELRKRLNDCSKPPRDELLGGATKERINGRLRLVYVGPKGGRYIKTKGQLVRVKKQV